LKDEIVHIEKWIDIDRTRVPQVAGDRTMKERIAQLLQQHLERRFLPYEIRSRRYLIRNALTV
jgi:hypothetical protein